MPVEHRQIIFSTQEIVDALVGLNTDAKQSSLGNILSLRVVEANGAVSAVISQMAKAVGKPTELTVRAEVLGAASIRQCRVERIPLPRSGTKHLARAGEGVARFVHGGLLG